LYYWAIRELLLRVDLLIAFCVFGGRRQAVRQGHGVQGTLNGEEASEGMSHITSIWCLFRMICWLTIHVFVANGTGPPADEIG
jgi:hypothetical protein